MGQNETAGHNETVALLCVVVSTRMGVREIYIYSREHEPILLNHKQKKWQKEAMMSMKQGIFNVQSAYF